MEDCGEFGKELFEAGVHLSRDNGEMIQEFVEVLDLFFAGCARLSIFDSSGTVGFLALLLGQAFGEDGRLDGYLLPVPNQRSRYVVDQPLSRFGGISIPDGIGL